MFDLRTIHRLNDEFVARDNARRASENRRLNGVSNLEAEIDAQDPDDGPLVPDQAVS